MSELDAREFTEWAQTDDELTATAWSGGDTEWQLRVIEPTLHGATVEILNADDVDRGEVKAYASGALYLTEHGGPSEQMAEATRRRGGGESSTMRVEVSPGLPDDFEGDESVTAHTIAAKELAETISEALSDDAYGVEVDAPHRELWVHHVTDDELETAIEAMASYIAANSASARAPLRVSVDVQSYHGDHDDLPDQQLHLGDIHFDYGATE